MSNPNILLLILYARKQIALDYEVSLALKEKKIVVHVPINNIDNSLCISTFLF